MRALHTSRLAALAVALTLSACVELREPYEPDTRSVEVLPGQQTVWHGQDATTTGVTIVFPAGAVQQAQVFRIEDITATASPLTDSSYELVVTALTLTPVDWLFEVPVQITMPKSRLAEDTKVRVLVSPDVDHLREGFWDYADVNTGSVTIDFSLQSSGSFWPTRVLSTPPAVEDATAPTSCFAPEDPADPLMELPELEGECARDSDCVVSGCQNEICSTVRVESVCRPAPMLCAECACIGQVCRWIK